MRNGYVKIAKAFAIIILTMIQTNIKKDSKYQQIYKSAS